MTRLKNIVSAVTVGLLIPSLGLAITESERLSQVKGITYPLTRSSLPKSTDPRDAEVEAKADELAKKLELTAAEEKWLKIVRQKRKERDSAKTAQTLPELLERNIQDGKEQKRQQFAQMFPALQAPANQLNAARLKSNEDSCPADFGGYSSMSAALSTDLVTQMQQNGQKFMNQTKEEKLATIQQLQDLNKKFKDNIKSRREKEKSVLEQSSKRSFKDSIAKMKSGVEGLKDLADELDNDRDKRLAALGDDLFTKFLPKALEDNKDLKELQQLVMQIQAKLEPERQFAYNSGIAAEDKLHTACLDMRDAIKTGQNGQPGIATTVMQVVQSQNPGEAGAQAAAQYNQQVAQVSQDLQCRGASDQIEAAVGEPMRQKIASLSGVPDSVTLMQTVLNLVPQMVNTIGQSQGPLEDAITDCVKVAEQKKAFESIIASSQTQQAGQAQARLGSQRRRPSGPGFNQTASAGQNSSFLNQGQGRHWQR